MSILPGLVAAALILVLIWTPNALAQTILFEDDFQGSLKSGWEMWQGWSLQTVGQDRVLAGTGHTHANIRGVNWKIHSLKVRVYLTDSSSAIHLTLDERTGRYFMGVNDGGLSLNKSLVSGYSEFLGEHDAQLNINQWYEVVITVEDGHIQAFLDGAKVIDVNDPAPLLPAHCGLENLSDAFVYYDDVVVATNDPSSLSYWSATGGPLGGLGYDVRIHPQDKKRMYVTDNFAGVALSEDGGRSWTPSNRGITVTSGPNGEFVNIFCLTVDPNSPNILWAGTNGAEEAFGVFKSTDNGQTWSQKSNGIELGDGAGLVFRGFTIQQGNSNVVYAQAEVPTEEHGREFNKVKGRIYKTIDGGENWTLIWQGNDLARYLIIHPTQPNTLYASTGIFDREAYNSDCNNDTPGGVGVLKSTDGGQTFNTMVNGLDDLYVGSLRMHPANPDILAAACGNNACSGGYDGITRGGLFITTDGGQTWTRAIDEHEVFTAVNFSPSSPNIMYAGSSRAIYRSQDTGQTWQRYSKGDGPWGPEGVRAGVPIDLTVDPDDPNFIFANNYGGGVFRSENGGQTWEDSSKGYSGAEVHAVATVPTQPNMVLAIGRSGPYLSTDFGSTWQGIGHSPASEAEWYAIAVDPANPQNVIMADEHEGFLFRSTDGGNSFTRVLDHPESDAEDPNHRQGFKALVYAPSDPSIVYAGIAVHRGDYRTKASRGTVFYRSTDGGATFAALPGALDGTSVNHIAVHSTNPQILFAACVNGIYKSINGGQTFTAIAQHAGRHMEAVGIDWNNPNQAMCGEFLGGIWATSDGGATWGGPTVDGFNSANPAITSICQDTEDPAVIYCGTSYSGVYRTMDSGTTWAPFPGGSSSGLTAGTVSDIVVSSGMIYASTEGAGVFRYSRIKGDMNNDGFVGVPDAVLILQALSNQETTPMRLDLECTGDGRTGLPDLVNILQTDAGLD